MRLGDEGNWRGSLEVLPHGDEQNSLKSDPMFNFSEVNIVFNITSPTIDNDRLKKHTFAEE